VLPRASPTRSLESSALCSQRFPLCECCYRKLNIVVTDATTTPEIVVCLGTSHRSRSCFAVAFGWVNTLHFFSPSKLRVNSSSLGTEDHSEPRRLMSAIVTPQVGHQVAVHLDATDDLPSPKPEQVDHNEVTDLNTDVLSEVDDGDTGATTPLGTGLKANLPTTHLRR